MLPLLDFRSKWININDADQKEKEKLDEERQHRDSRRMNGSLTVYKERLVHGPYKAYYREDMLRVVLEAQCAVRELGPDSVSDLELFPLRTWKKFGAFGWLRSTRSKIACRSSTKKS